MTNECMFGHWCLDIGHLPLGDNLPLPFDVVPHDVAVEIAASSEEDAALRALGQTISEANVFFRLRPARHEKQVDRDAFAGAQHSFACKASTLENAPLAGRR